jgi:hypothetical protein
MGTPERGLKESGIIGNFHQSGKGHKGANRKEAKKERGRIGKRQKGIWPNQVFTKPECGLKKTP